MGIESTKKWKGKVILMYSKILHALLVNYYLMFVSGNLLLNKVAVKDEKKSLTGFRENGSSMANIEWMGESECQHYERIEI